MTETDPAWVEWLPGLRSRLVGRARHLGVDAETADDLAQEALVEVLNCITDPPTVGNTRLFRVNVRTPRDAERGSLA